MTLGNWNGGDEFTGRGPDFLTWPTEAAMPVYMYIWRKSNGDTNRQVNIVHSASGRWTLELDRQIFATSLNWPCVFVYGCDLWPCVFVHLLWPCVFVVVKVSRVGRYGGSLRGETDNSSLWPTQELLRNNM